MKKNLLMISLASLLVACGGSAEEGTTTDSTQTTTAPTENTVPEQPAETGTAGAIDTPQNAADTYCAKMQERDAAPEADREKLNQELNDLENKIEAEHDGDDAWFEEFETILESICPEA